jgi:hypothetical protein
MQSRIGISIALAALCATFVCCRTHTQANAPRLSIDRTSVDLQPGWRVLVVAPILKSGGFKTHFEEMQSKAGTVTLKTGEDFKGYETDYYRVVDNGSELVVRFSSAEIRHNDGTTTQPLQPLVPLFILNEGIHYVRLLFLTRVSEADHNEAILASESLEKLDTLTRTVEADPVQNCKVQSQGSCVWVPEDVAVRPQKKSGKAWVPVL